MKKYTRGANPRSHRSMDLINQRFGHGVVKKLLRHDNGLVWEVLCDCSNAFEAKTTNLRAGHQTCCGRSCPYYQNSGRFPTKHGYAKTKDYNRYRAMIGRCYYKSHQDYKNYGARGIKIYKPWIDEYFGYRAFRRYIKKHLGKRPKGMTLDRINNDKGYFPGNLRWATLSQQNTNQRRIYDLTDKTFGVITVIKRSKKDTATGLPKWWCFCDPELGGCGNVIRIIGSNLKSGHTKSCGCMPNSGRFKKHNQIARKPN